MNPFQTRAATAAQQAGYNQGLRAYFIKVYNFMGLGLALTGLVAFAVSQSDAAIALLFGTPLKWLVVLAPLVMAIVFGFKVHTMRYESAKILFWVYAGLMGLSLSTLFLIYTGESIARTFFITASVFGAMSLYGYTTKRDLTGMGSFLIMGVIGLIIASLVNLFLQSSGLQFAVSALGVLIFTGLTAYDTQRIREMYYYAGSDEQSIGKMALMGAFSLYLDFINLFMSMMQFFGDRR